MDERSFAEKIRETGSYIAHKAYGEITDLAGVVPQICEEIKVLGSHCLPSSITPLNGDDMASPVENYEKLVAKGHEAIDKVFSTDQADFFTADAHRDDSVHNFAIGVIPLPSGVLQFFSNTSNLIRAGNVVDRAGFTRVGRGLMKHGYREGSPFPKPLGNSAQINKQGEACTRGSLKFRTSRNSFILRFVSKNSGSTLPSYG